MTTAPTSARSRRHIGWIATIVLSVSIGLATNTPASAEPASCLSSDASQWPNPAKPYFMVVVDTSSSMATAAPPNSCGYPANRLGLVRCALHNAFKSYSGLAHFGLASLARQQLNCPGASCFAGCTYADFPGNVGDPGCGPQPGGTRAGANILVPLPVDSPNAAAGNVSQLLTWTDNDCNGSQELFADGARPVNGAFQDVYRYLSNQWTSPAGSPTYGSPLTSAASGERPCRSVNVILITAGLDSCNDNSAFFTNPLFGQFTKDGIAWKVRPHLVWVGAQTTIGTNNVFVSNGGRVFPDVNTLSGSVTAIGDDAAIVAAIGDLVGTSITPEVCDNADNDCNGCTDEGFSHYANSGQTCCPAANAAQRAACLATYATTNSPSDLPCTTAAQQADPSSWLCINPGDRCDDSIDNNLNGTLDENLKCGSPPHCVSVEVCNGIDDDCDGVRDEGCPTVCHGKPEVCDGCDNDCNGVADDAAPVPCGLEHPPNCRGVTTCNSTQPIGVGGCFATNPGYTVCNNTPLPEQCDNLDNDCDGITDNVAPEPCGAVPGRVYGGTSQCRLGQSSCVSGAAQCSGDVPPSAEVCDGIDNDCDGVTDNAIAGLGQACGVTQTPCSTGALACVGGTLVCQGGVQPQPEVCDGIDNNCNGATDELPLADAPAAGQAGCWSDVGTSCSHAGLTWNTPAGASCSGNGSLAQPCNHGSLTCSGGAWSCQMALGPTAEHCDGIDNDCDGSVDDGSGLCSGGLSCQQGLCRP